MPDEPTTLPDGPVAQSEPSGDKPLPSELEDPVSFGRWLFELVVLVGLAFLLAQGIKTWVVQPFVIPSGSMEPTLAVGDRVLVNKFLFRFREPAPGDIVVFKAPDNTKTDYIKRVIAVGGQVVDISGGVVFVDGRALDEPYTAGTLTEPMERPLPVRVPKGQVFLMGDNRPNSRDGRVFGPRPESQIVGKAFFIYWPPRNIGTP